MQQELCLQSPVGTLIEDNEEEPPGITLPFGEGLRISPNLVFFRRKNTTITTTVKTDSTKKGRTLSKTRAFRKNFFPDVSDKEWNDWGWQISHRIRKPEQLSRILALSSDEQSALEQPTRLPLGITPYYMSLFWNETESPLRRTVIPTIHEFVKMPDEADDPLGEESQSPVPACSPLS